MPRFAEDLGVVRAIEERLLPECRQGKKDRRNPNAGSALAFRIRSFRSSPRRDPHRTARES